MQDLENRLRQLSDKVSREAPSELRPTPRALRRIRVGRAVRSGAVLATVAALVFGGFAGARSLSSDEALPPADPDAKESVFVNTWVSTDLDGSTQTMVVRASGEDAYEIVMRDDSAGVCSGAPSTMRGAARLGSATELVIASPVLTCDDGSEPEALSGPPLEEQLRNFTFVHDLEADNLTDNLGVVWDRGETTESSGGMWPQSSLEEVRRAQRLADAGDPRYTWQVMPDWPPYAEGKPALELGDVELFTRFVEEELGWEKFSWGVGPGLYPPEDWPWQFIVVRCAPGRTNPLYPNDPDGRECAPTIDESRYETVQISADMPVRVDDPSGIWVVTRWEMLQPSDAPVTSIDDFYRHQIQQVVPPSDAEVEAFLRAFLQARVDGEGAEEYLHAPVDGEIPLLYATTSDAPYERFEFELARGPVWPSGWIEFKVRLFAEGGTMVEQPFLLDRGEDGRLVLVYRTLEDHDVPTTENGEAVAEPYEFFDGEVTLHAADPWTNGGYFWGLMLDPNDNSRLELVRDPRPVETGCRKGPAPADAESLARTIGSDPDVAATTPAAVTVGGIDAQRLDVTAARGGSVCEDWGAPQVLQLPRGDQSGRHQGISLEQGNRTRLYLLDVPDGSSTRILAIAIIAPEDRFESVVKAAAPIVDSIEFHAP